MKNIDSIRRNIEILLHSDNILSKMSENNPEREEVEMLRDLSYINLLKAQYPFIDIPDQDEIWMHIDGKKYVMEKARLYRRVGEKAFYELLNPKDNAENEECKEDATLYEKAVEQATEDIYKGDDSNTKEMLKELLELVKSEPGNEEDSYNDNCEDENVKLSDESFNNIDSNEEEIEETFHTFTATNNLSATIEIGIMGLTHGAGTTHTAISLANFLTKCGDCNVAILEFNKTKAIKHLVQFATKENTENFASINNVDFFFDTNYQYFINNYRDDYDYVIIDFGTYSEKKDLTKFVQTALKIVVCSSAEWNLHDAISFEKSNRNLATSKSIIYVSPMNTNIHLLKKIFKHNTVFSLPVNSEPFNLTDEEKQKFGKLFDIEVKEKKKNFFFFNK